VGQENIVVRWDQRASNSGSKYSRLQYTTNGTTFTDFPTPVIMSLANIFEPKTNNLSAIAGVRNNPLFAFRIVSEWQNTAIGSGSSQYLTASTSSYSSGGTLRFDMVTVSGTAIQAGGQAILSASGVDANGQFKFSISGSTGFNYAIEASTDLSVWTRLLTNTTPFNFTDTASPAPLQRFYRAVLVP
jgi:spore coat protein U-like protein